MITSAQIVAEALAIAKCPGFTAQGGRALNLVLNDLVLHRDLKLFGAIATGLEELLTLLHVARRAVVGVAAVPFVALPLLATGAQVEVPVAPDDFADGHWIPPAALTCRSGSNTARWSWPRYRKWRSHIRPANTLSTVATSRLIRFCWLEDRLM